MSIQFNHRFSRRLAVLALLAMIGGCNSDTSTRSEQANATPIGIPDAEFEPLAFLTAEGSAPAAKAGAAASVTSLISAEEGGHLKLKWRSGEEEGGKGARVNVTVTVPPGSLEKDSPITIDLIDPTRAMLRVNLVFGEHGTQFKIPAEVKLFVSGLDFDGDRDGDDGYGRDDDGLDGGGGDDSVIDFYWFDPDTDTWYAVRRDESKYSVDREAGTLRGVWYFDHFSRYSLSRGSTENCCWAYLNAYWGG